MMKVFWTPEAIETYGQELNYIQQTWGQKTMLKFSKRVENCIRLLQNGTIEARYSKKTDVHFFVISKQTSIVYRIYTSKNQIDLLLFWNNKRSPNNLKKFLRKS